MTLINPVFLPIFEYFSTRGFYLRIVSFIKKWILSPKFKIVVGGKKYVLFKMWYENR